MPRLQSWIPKSWLPKVPKLIAPAKRRTGLLQVLNLEDRITPANFFVNNLLDSGAGSLRQAVLDANANVDADNIVFTVAGTVPLASTIAISTAVAISTIPAGVIISGGGSVGVFNTTTAPAGTAISFNKLTIANGIASDGGGIRAGDEAITLNSVTVRDNTAITDGGGIFFSGAGSLTVNNSTFSKNQSSFGGAIDFFSSGGSLTLNNATITGNTATQRGGGIYFVGSVSGSGVLIRNSTITGNSSGSGGGLYLSTTLATAISSTIISENQAGTGPDLRKLSGTVQIDFSAYGSAAGFTAVGSNNLIGQDLKLGALADNGGPVLTILPAVDSPVRDVGANAGGLTTDARGSGFPRVINGQADIGAIELDTLFLVTNTNDAGAGSLRQAVLNANAFAGPDTITFDASFDGAKTITLTTGELEISDGVTITGKGSALTTISGNSASRIFNVTSSVNATFDAMTFTLAKAAGIGGAIAGVSGSTITVQNMSLTGNSASTTGGAIGTNGVLIVTDSTIFANSSGSNIGGVYGVAGMTLTRTVITGNSATGSDGGAYRAGTSLIESSTISNNTAGNNGGGIGFGSGTTIIRNSTIANNTSNSSGNGGGGIYYFGSGTVSVQNSTIINNSSASNGGGLVRTGSGTVLLESSIVSGNTGAATGPDIFSTGTVNVNFSAIGSATGFTLTGANNLAFGTDLKLGPLADNGGSTLTHLPTPDSPLRGAGSNPAMLATDQRGFARTDGIGNIDIGSVQGTVSSVVVNSAAVQRSRLTTIQVNLAAPVNAASIGAITLTRTHATASGTVGTVVTTGSGLIVSPVSGLTSVLTLTFENINTDGVEFGSLADGRWQLAIPSLGFTSAAGDTNLRRLFGDINNDGTIDGSTDFSAFGAAFGTTTVASPFDFNNDGTIDGSNDFAAFGNRFGVTL